MIRKLFVLGSALSLMGCTESTEVAQRYRAERDLWKANAAARQLAIRPDLVSDARWEDVANKFEAVATRNTLPGVADPTSSPETHSLRQIIARALTSAAKTHAVRGDTVNMVRLYTQIENEFTDLPRVQGEVAHAQAQLAETRGDWVPAAELYERVIETVPPAPGQPGVAGVVLDLPLRVARLHRQADSESRQVVDAYQLARSQYEEWASTAAGTLIEIDSKAHLADVANELGEPHVAIRQLQDLEKELITLKSPQRDPAEVRFGIARVLARVEGMSDSSVATLKSIVSDYPTSAFAPRALLNLASEAATRGEVEESLGYLDRLSSEFPQASLANAKALLTRARLLEKHDRWREAVDAYRTLPVSHPLTREALEAPLEIVAHYVRVGDDTERDRALVRAEKDYLKFIERFTDGPLTQFARYQLVQTLIVQERFSEALSGLIELSESSAGTRLGAAYKLQAAKLANDLGDSTRARAIIDEIQSQYGKGRRDTNSVINNTEAQSP